MRRGWSAGSNLRMTALSTLVARQIRYVNLKPALIRVVIGRDRVENVLFIASRSHVAGKAAIERGKTCHRLWY